MKCYEKNFYYNSTHNYANYRIYTVLFTIVSNFMLEFKNNEINTSFVSFITIVLLITVIYTGGVSIHKLYENQTRVNKIVYYKEILDILNEK